MLHNEKGTFMVPFLLWHKSDITPDLLRAVHELPGSPGARRARAVVEHTRKPGGLPRPERRGHLRADTPAQPGASGAVRSGIRVPYAPASVFSEKKLRLGKPFGLPGQLFY